MKIKKRRPSFRSLSAVTAAAALLSMFAASPASAITADEVIDKMEPRERAMFLSGAADMASYLYAVNGDQEKAACVVSWFFDNEDSNRQIHRFLSAQKDKDAVGLLSILIDRECGK